MLVRADHEQLNCIPRDAAEPHAAAPRRGHHADGAVRRLPELDVHRVGGVGVLQDAVISEEKGDIFWDNAGNWRASCDLFYSFENPENSAHAAAGQSPRKSRTSVDVQLPVKSHCAAATPASSANHSIGACCLNGLFQK